MDQALPKLPTCFEKVPIIREVQQDFVLFLFCLIYMQKKFSEKTVKDRAESIIANGIVINKICGRHDLTSNR